jgi:hypothetical protein
MYAARVIIVWCIALLLLMATVLAGATIYYEVFVASLSRGECAQICAQCKLNLLKKEKGL